MFPQNRITRLPFAAIVILAFAMPCHAQWTGSNIGGATGGSSTWSPSTGALTIVGAGTGAAISTDQLRFTSVPVSGNFKLVARVASFTGGANSQVGLAVRENMTATCSVGGIYFMPGAGSGTLPNKVVYQQRNMEPGALYKWTHPTSNGVNTPISAPFWLQLVRVGNNFAVYRSTNGKDWSQVGNNSGSAFTISGTVNLGFVVASGGAGMVTAVLDNIYLKRTATSMLPWRTSWLGNTYGADSTSAVSSDVAGMWVGPDGTCYTNSFQEEAGEPTKIYKDGMVLKNTLTGPYGIYGGAAEGSITGDAAGNLFMVGLGYGTPRVFQTWFPGGVGGNPSHRTLFTSDPVVTPTGASRVSGLAVSGSGAEVYISRVADDPLTQQEGKVIVVNPNKALYFSQNFVSWSTTTSNSIDMSLVTPNGAPESVYQSQQESYGNNAITYTVPGLAVAANYRVRLHFAELKATAAGQRKMTLTVSGSGTPPPPLTDYDVFALTGNNFKAIYQDFSVTSSAAGTVTVSVTGTVGNGILNGIEIHTPAPEGTLIKRINCGGSDATVSGGNWESQVHQVRSFAVTRPGPLCVDKRGNLWIIQEGSEYPISHKFSSTSGWGAVKCYDTYGNLLKEITDLVNPRAIYYDDRNGADRLLVAENGPNQNIRIYTGLTGTPTCTSTFGQQGGVFSGGTPGLVYDAAAGNDARFYGFADLGMDSGGNLYVACNGGLHHTDLKKFAVSGATWSTTAAWKLRSLEEISCGDFDPTVNASDVWSLGKHYTMNYSATAPGGEWSLKSYQWNPFQYSATAAWKPPGAMSTVYRKINGTGVLYCVNQPYGDVIHIYRLAGEQLAYCGKISGSGWSVSVWKDGNGNGQEDTGETTTAAKVPSNNGHVGGFDVDNNGNIYLAMEGTATSGFPVPYVHKLFCSGVSGGVPQYAASSFSSVTTPPPFNGNWVAPRLKYAGGANDTMFLMGRESPNAADGTYGGIVARYDNWSSSPSLVFSTTLPKPTTDYNFVAYPNPYPWNLGFKYMGFDVVGNYAFAGELWGPVHVINAATGAYTTQLLPGPEVNGLIAWQDMCMGLRAHHNAADDEYYVLTENSSWRGRNNFFRWKPVKKTQTVEFALDQTSGTPVPDISGSGNNGTLNGTVSGTTWKGGRFENALNFNGTNNWVSLPNNLIKNYTTLAFSCWFRTSSSAGCPILGYASSAPPAQPAHYIPAVYVGTDGKLRGEFYNSTGTPITTPGTVNDGMWHHVALVGNVNSQSLYLDGQLVGTMSGTINHLSMQYNFLGYSFTPGWPALSNWNSYFQGDMDDVRFYSQALSAEEVANLAAH